MEKSCLNILSIDKHIDDDYLNLNVKIKNTLDRTVYSYAVVRRILYDTVKKELSLFLHDKHIMENTQLSKHLKEPKFLEYEAVSETTLKLKIHKVLKRLKSHTETGADRLEILDVFNVEKINIEIAHQDTPFYFNPKEDNATQLKKWGKPIAVVAYNFNKNKDKKK
jgi:hypothetical protein